VTDLTAFKDLYTRLFPLLCQKAYAYVNDADAAKDIVQEVFVRYWSTKPEVATIAEAYLYKAVINQCLNYIDAHKRRSAATLGYGHTQPLSANPVEEAIISRELREKVERLITELPTVCRNVFLLSRYEGMDHKSIAAHLNISPNTVDNHIKRALKLFRENLP
jgi:RNA polymerase sigma-70 factor (family 1)